MNKNIHIKVPKDSTEWDIDDFLGNSFQYKIGESWFYDTSVSLPNCDLVIVGLATTEYCELNSLDISENWVIVGEK